MSTNIFQKETVMQSPSQNIFLRDHACGTEVNVEISTQRVLKGLRFLLYKCKTSFTKYPLKLDAIDKVALCKVKLLHRQEAINSQNQR